MEKIKLFKRFVVCFCAVIMAFSAVCSSGYVINSIAHADTEAEQNQTDIDSAKDKISELEKKQEELDKKISETQDDIDKEKENQAAIEEQIETVSATIKILDESILDLTNQIEALQADITVSEKKIVAKQAEIESGVNDFKLRLRAMYVAGTDSYTEILLGANDFYDMLMKIELVTRVADHDNDMIDSLIEMKEQYEADQIILEGKREALEADEKEVESEKASQEKQKTKLNGLYAESKAMIAQLKEDEDNYQANKDAIDAEKQDFEDDLQSLYEKEESRKKAEEEAKKQQEQNNNNTSSDNDSTSNDYGTNDDNGYTSSTNFTWPVPGCYGISSPMGWRWGAYHKGIDIWSSNIRGATVIASDGGTVIQANNTCTHDYGKNSSCGCGGGYGNYVVIDHGNGYWTLYGHMQYINVSLGDTVSQGDSIGVVGTTGYSTGDHLHFEVRLNGSPVNPSDYV